MVDDLPAAAAAADKQNKVEAKEDNDKKDNHDDQYRKWLPFENELPNVAKCVWCIEFLTAQF